MTGPLPRTPSESPAGLPSSLDHPTDVAICRLLMLGPMTAGAIAERLGVPARTIRYRIARLRESGLVRWEPDGTYRLAGPSLPPVRRSVPELAASVATAAAAGREPVVAAGPAAMPPVDAAATRGLELLPAVAATVAVLIAVALYLLSRRQSPTPTPDVPSAWACEGGGWPAWQDW